MLLHVIAGEKTRPTHNNIKRNKSKLHAMYMKFPRKRNDLNN
jgi:hypothetical protein